MNHPPASLFDQFLKERLFLKNVSPRTLLWYRIAFKNFRATLSADAHALPSKASLQAFVIHERERGIRPVTVNTYIAALNAYCGWLHQEGHLKERLTLAKLRTERRVLALLDDGQMKRVIGWKPRTYREWRLHVAILTMLDCGLRISEALHLRQRDVDQDNLLLTVLGQGQQRAAGALFTGTPQAPVSIRAAQSEEGHPLGVRLRGLRGHAVGGAQ